MRHYVGVRDILMMHTVVESADSIESAEPCSECRRRDDRHGAVHCGCFENAQSVIRNPQSDKPLIAATMFGVTTPCVEAARGIAEEAGLRSAGFPRHRHRRADDGIVHKRWLDSRRPRHHHHGVGGRLGRRHFECWAGSPDGGGLAGVPQVISLGRPGHGEFRPRRPSRKDFRDADFIGTTPT